jgi:DNA-binding protein HU-beta
MDRRSGATGAAARSGRTTREAHFPREIECRAVRAFRFNAGHCSIRDWRFVLPLTQTQLAAEVADRAGLSTADAKRALAALEEVILDQIGDAEKVKIGGVVQIEAKMRPATKERLGRNPATGEEITISAKPASVAVKARPLTKAKAAAPSLEKVQAKAR